VETSVSRPSRRSWLQSRRSGGAIDRGRSFDEPPAWPTMPVTHRETGFSHDAVAKSSASATEDAISERTMPSRD
jgi:hypothetical protein